MSAATGPAPGRAPGAVHVARVARWCAPVLLGVLALAVWQAVVVGAELPPYLLPSPTAIVEQLRLVVPLVWSAALATGANVLVGLVAGALLAVGAAVLAARSRLVDGLLSPTAAALAVMPIVALAPALNTLFGTTSTTPRRLVVAVVVFAPVFVNTLRGLRQVQPVHRDLLRAYAATPRQVTRTVTIPGALPYLFTGLRIAASTGVIAAVVAEYFGGLQNGLGSRITAAAANSAYARAWAFVLGAILLGLLFHLATTALERAVAHRHGVPET
ncbi:ABC transporter permease [Cellulomonas fimi]|uniref:Binding-protein-dependent transport systems inner membrane component n=1 Tax=Cellulomonas fimi (strain ATCC 484 / DSM 20113 / JCM 1341 / CCUG 24087 / LMG 16345 / NBRC 15513 / NCIMB 8980 / NCTC 7547 / NRS-133) TaxID=590998 RepID=F4H6G2_CELFA|nr:ABC transporter permease subunit [Cellulomonas fimi]AEE45595.1 binding-protein-dependent transport systems inner membrane component [Cellulomonas fimi ATCC 484]VEH29997.1 Putative aliphatic sulfonates transport permease protein ssuC [Cellulomonas fimi]